MNSPRCGYPDNRYDARTGWGYTDLTYRIDSYPTYEVSEAEVDQSIALAFKVRCYLVAALTHNISFEFDHRSFLKIDFQT